MNLRKLAAWLFLLVIVLYVITGFGITKYQVVGKLSFGLLTKALSFKIHSVLIWPLIILAVVHVGQAYGLFDFLKKDEN